MAFENLPDESRIWIYGFDRTLDSNHYDLVQERLERFKKEWMYHGTAVTGDDDIIEKQRKPGVEGSVQLIFSVS